MILSFDLPVLYSPHEPVHFLGFFTSWIRIQEDFLSFDADPDLQYWCERVHFQRVLKLLSSERGGCKLLSMLKYSNVSYPDRYSKAFWIRIRNTNPETVNLKMFNRHQKHFYYKRA